MLDSLPAEILLQVFEYLDGSTLVKVYQTSRRLQTMTEPRLRKICRKWTITLFTDWGVAPVLSDKHTLKFAKELVFEAKTKRDNLQGCYSDFSTNFEDGPMLAVTPLRRGLERHGLMSFRWEIGSCIPRLLLGPEGYLCEHQRNIECFFLDTRDCNHEHGSGLSMELFHKVRRFSWKGLCKIKDCISLAEFFSYNAQHLEQLELGIPHSLSLKLGEWECLQENRNAFASRTFRIQMGHAQAIFPRLRELALSGVEFKNAVPEMVYAFQLHQLRSLTLRKCATISELFNTIAHITTAVQLQQLDLEIDAANNEDTDAFERFFNLSFPNIEDVYIHVDAWDELSARVHWQSVLALGAQFKRFVYHRRLEARGPEVPRWLSTPPDTAVRLDQEMLAWLSGANLQCLAICENPSSLMEKLSQDDVPPLEWEILNIRTAPTHQNQYRHNLRGGSPTHSLDFESLNDFVSVISCHFPGLYMDVRAHTRYFTPYELLELFTFAAWVFGPKGLPKLELLVYGEVGNVHDTGASDGSKYIILRRNQTQSPLCLPFRPLEAIDDADIRASRGDVSMWRKFQSHAAFFETMPSSQWGFNSL